jgi:hypothetical protein
VAEGAAITVPELANDLASATGTRAHPSALSRWLIRNGYDAIWCDDADHTISR